MLRRAESATGLPEDVTSSHEGAKRLKWLGVRDDFRNVVADSGMMFPTDSNPCRR
jgi:hypothetical protein